MTKESKMRTLIRRELDRSLIPALLKQLNAHQPYIMKLKRHPEFIPGVIEELVDLQLPFYMMAPDDVADAAYDFFMTDLGTQWVDLCGRFNDKLNLIVPPFVLGVARRLDIMDEK